MAGLAPDDDGELALVVEFGGDGRIPDRVGVTDQAGRELGEQDDPVGLGGPALGDVIGVVETDADDLAGAQHRRRVLYALGSHGGGRGGGHRPRARLPPRTRRRRRRAGGRPPRLLGTVRPVSPAVILSEERFHPAKTTVNHNVRLRRAGETGRGWGGWQAHWGRTTVGSPPGRAAGVRGIPAAAAGTGR